ncbi:hypothetical protein L0666_05230 [Octadecabacter sp. CECT 8868]|uniref:tetratricopeptide repeat protein n=1 Tax=Octadecabacter algicola TaxID=2909342 RepID=UPI001F15FBB2|nr:tetratricopeptide repeat protein [Octadecabacter algicola]MCF2904380.1 hypothetical protein [Octadecabacter algicola]
MPIATLHVSDAKPDATFNPDQGPDIQEVRKKLDEYRQRPRIGFEAIRDNTDVCADPQIAAVFVECCIAAERPDVAEIALPLADDPQGCLAATLHMLNDKPAQALAALKGRPLDARHRSRMYGLRIRAHSATDNHMGAVQAAHEWSKDAPNSPAPMRVMAKTLAQAGDARAEAWFKRAIKVSGGRPALIMDLAEFLMEHGKTEAAKDHLSTITNATKQENRRKTRLLQAI